MKKCAIFGSSQIYNYEAINLTDYDFVIAADGGIKHLSVLKRNADILVGDYDSLEGNFFNFKEKVTVPCEKDDTDMLLAVKYAIQNHCNSIDIYGGLGGRIDHTYANIQMLEYLNDNNIKGSLIGDSDIITLQGVGLKEYLKLDGFYFSIFSFTANSIVTTRGTKYNLTDYKLDRSIPLGVSNEIIDEKCTIEVNSGKLLVIYSKK